MKLKLISLILALSSLAPALIACAGGSKPATTEGAVSTVATTEKKEEPAKNEYAAMSASMLDAMYEKYWVGGVADGHLRHIHSGEVITGDLIMIWETAMLMLAMENHYNATGDEATKNRIIAEWKYLQKQFSKKEMVSNCGKTPNLASDDTAWSALLYISVYRVTGDALALQYCKETVLNAYEYYKDGDIANGMWYCDTKQYDGDQWKSLYCAGFILAALEYCEITKGTDAYSEELYTKTMALYGWFEENMRRAGPKTFENGLQNGNTYTVDVNDGLYWCDYNWDRDNRDERFGPDGALRPYGIRFGDSVSFLYGNMAMAAVNARLYKESGEESYLEKALQTVGSLNEYYVSDSGTYINDRDPFTNGAGLYYYVKFVLTLEEVDSRAVKLLSNTANVIFTKCVKDGAEFSHDWSKYPADFSKNFVKCATTLAFVSGAAYAKSLGVFDMKR